MLRLNAGWMKCFFAVEIFGLKYFTVCFALPPEILKHTHTQRKVLLISQIVDEVGGRGLYGRWNFDDGVKQRGHPLALINSSGMNDVQKKVRCGFIGGMRKRGKNRKKKKIKRKKERMIDRK